MKKDSEYILAGVVVVFLIYLFFRLMGYWIASTPRQDCKDNARWIDTHTLAGFEQWKQAYNECLQMSDKNTFTLF